MGSDGEDDDGLDDLEDLGELWESFAQRWEQEFQRFNEAEEAQLRHLADEVNKLAVKGSQAYGAAVEKAMEDGDSAARHRSQVAGSVVETEHAHKFQEVSSDGRQCRTGVAVQAMRESDDMVKNIMEASEQKKREREAKRKEEKLKRDSEFAARQKARREADRQQAADEVAREAARDGGQGQGAGPEPGPSAGAGAGARGPEPRFTRTPGAHAAAAAAAAAKGAARPEEIRTFLAFDAAWRDFEKRLQSDAFTACGIGLADVPWPTKLPTVCGIEAADGPKERKQKFRAAVLRWHPDKWAPVLARVKAEEKQQVVEQVQAVTRRILEERKKFS